LHDTLIARILLANDGTVAPATIYCIGILLLLGQSNLGHTTLDRSVSPHKAILPYFTLDLIAHSDLGHTTLGRYVSMFRNSYRTLVHTYMHTDSQSYRQAYIHTYTDIHAYIHTHIQAGRQEYIQTTTHTYTCIHTYINKSCIHIYILTYINTYIGRET